MKRKPRLFITLIIVSLLLSIITASCTTPRASTASIRVGSKDFTEQFILANMYALVLEDAGFKVERKLNLGGTPRAQDALEKGEIDLYPEYTGTALLTVLKLPASNDPEEVYALVNAEYQKQFNLTWLEPSPMNNSQALAMTREGSEKFGITTISDMAAKASELVMVGPPEFKEREDGLPGLQRAYGNFVLKEYKAVDPGLRYKALVDGHADVSVAFVTDGEISAFNLVLLEDDRKLFPPYQVAPLIRNQTLEKFPEIADVLNNLAPHITDEAMQKLNYEVVGKGREPVEVAREFLVANGLLK